MKAAKMRMSAAGGAIRRKQELQMALTQTRADLFALENTVGADAGLSQAFRLRDVLICQQMYLSAMLDYAEKGFATRGSALYYHPEGQLRGGLEEVYRFIPNDGAQDDQVQEICYTQVGCKVNYRPVRPLPEGGGFFENVWREYRENQGVLDC